MHTWGLFLSQQSCVNIFLNQEHFWGYDYILVVMEISHHAPASAFWRQDISDDGCAETDVAFAEASNYTSDYEQCEVT